MTAPRLAPPCFVLLLLGGAACVSPSEHGEVAEEARYYQSAYHDLAADAQQRDAELERLRDRNAELQAGLQEASARASEFDPERERRLIELEELGARMALDPGDAVAFPIEGGFAVVLGTANFQSGSEALSPAGRAAVLALAADLGSRDVERLVVRGHTDSEVMRRQESLERFPYGNLQLSAERALAVAGLLVAEGGVDPGVVGVAGLGPNEPVASNDTPEGRAANRRVEIFVIEAEPVAAEDAADRG